jgi:Pro-kumamolisin, activation domain/Bacterial Ig-like domain (group 3)
MTYARPIRPVSFVFLATFALLLASLSQAMFAKVTTAARPEVRVTKKVENDKRATLYGHVSGAIRTATDLGRQEPSTPSPGMIMVLKSSEEQKREIRKLVDEQQDRRTVNYHQWVTPEEFGEYFGVHDADLEQIKDWLRSQGFTVDSVSKSKRVIRFSGNIGQIEQAFQTEMHLYNYKGELHVANNSEISVPEAFKKVIAGVTLHNFYRKGSFESQRQIKLGGTFKSQGPKYTSSSTTHYVGPADFATIYNTAPLLTAGINGAGETIAIVGRSDILMSDVESYRQLFNLPPNDPTFIHAGVDNGVNPGDDGESDLDVEISGGYAPNAHVDFVIGTPTFLVDGITNSFEYIVENNLADIVSSSYGNCELNEGTGGNAFNNQAFEQAAAQGMSVFIAAGDNGPAECDDQNDSLEVLGYAAGAESSTPYSVAVGGTEMYGECAAPGVGCSQANFAKYWNTSNSLYESSALEYVPEVPWNDGKGSISTASSSSALSGLWSGSGGISQYYLRPSWQTGANSAILASSTDPAPVAYLSGSGGSITVESPGYWVTGVTVTNPGSGYTAATTTVTFSGGTCTTLPTSGATASISGGSVATTNGLAQITFNFGTQGGTVTAGQGLNCTVAPTVTFGTSQGGVGDTATGTAVLGPMEQLAPLVTGVPHRLTPDFALNASSSHDATIFCSEGNCEFTTNSSGQSTFSNAGLVGGTSVAAPSMAGIQALINQYNAVNNPEPGNPTGRQGQPNYVYYGLAAAQNNTTCNSNALIPPNDSSATNCAFQDIQSGNTYICGTSTCTSSSGTKIGWAAGAGYDLASGLGSANAYNIATQWSSVSFNSTSTTLNALTGGAHGAAVTLSGTVTPDPGSGQVAFIVSQGEIGDPVNLISGAFVYPGAFATVDNGCGSPGCFTVTLNNLPGGSSPYNVTARYGGNGTYASSVSSPQQISVGTEAVNITITPGYINGTACTLNTTNSFTYGQNLDIQVNVAGVSGYGVPTGTVNITVDSNSYGTENLDSNGNGYLVSGAVPDTSCIWDYMEPISSAISGGTHTVSATYSGDNTFQSGTAASPASITVAQISTTPTLAAGATLITSGFADTLTATFAANSAVTSNSTLAPPGLSGPTGTVTFTDTTTNTVLGTASVVPSVTYVGGSSSAAPTWTYAGTALLSPTGITTTGANSITATYSGDNNYAGATSSAVSVTVGTGTATTTTLTSNANPTTINGRPTFTATMAGGTAPVAGTVTFYDATYGLLLGTGTVSTAHIATFRLASGYPFVGGNHSIVAQYGGSTTFMASTSAALVETVTKGAGSVVLSSKQADIAGNSWTFGAVFTPTPSSTGFEPILGVMTFYDAVNGGAATAIATAVPNNIYASQGGYGLWTASGSATLSTPGTHVITASYTDVNYTSSTSNSMTVYVTNTGSASGIYFPLPGSTLAATGTTNFKWFANGANAAAHYWLDIGSTQGGNTYSQSGNLGNVLSQTVNNNVFPTNGSTVWARLWSLVNGVWQFSDAQYTASGTSSGLATITSPVPPGPLSGSSVTFNWNAGTNVTAYALNVGNTAGSGNYYQSGNLSTQTATVNGLPTNGSTVYVTLFSEIGGNWQNNQYTYTAYNAASAAGVMQTPTPGSTFTGSTVTFTWSAGAGASSYWLDVGSTAGGNQYSQSGSLGNVQTTTVSGLPTDGSTIYATLYSLIGGNWVGNSYTYYALNATGGLAAMQTPVSGTFINGSSATFTWSLDSSATSYWVDISAVQPGGNDVFQSGSLGNVSSVTVNSLPGNGTTTLYVTLYSYVGGQWLSNAYTYTN